MADDVLSCGHPATPNRDRRVDACIANGRAFAQPEFEHLRAVVHEACPAVQETIRWGLRRSQ